MNFVHFKTRENFFFILTSIILIAGIMSFSVYREIKITENYLLSIFDTVKNELEILTEDTKIKAEEVVKQLEMQDSVFVDSKSIEALTIHTYPERGNLEFGFNQGVYNDNVAVGSLYGNGTIPKDFNKQQFLVLDRIWSGYQVSLLNTLSYVINFEQQFIYLNSLTKVGKVNAPIFTFPLSPERYFAGLGDTYKSSIEENGYFISDSLHTFIDNDERIFIVFPIYRDGKYEANLGTAFRREDLKSLFKIYPKLDEGVEIHIVYPSGMDIYLSETAYKTIPVYSLEYELPGGLSISASYDLLYFIKEKLQLFIALCVFVALLYGYLVANAKRRRYKAKLLQQLDIDPMTQLYNRRVIDSQIIQDVKTQRAEKQTTAVAIIAIDADKFKAINDTYGHHVGDKAILHIAKTMNDFIREGDYCIRMGGDEFMIVLFNVDHSQAEDIAGRLTEKVRATSEESVGVEFSVTCAAIELKENEVFDEAYKRVDDGLYKNKKGES